MDIGKFKRAWYFTSLRKGFATETPAYCHANCSSICEFCGDAEVL